MLSLFNQTMLVLDVGGPTVFGSRRGLCNTLATSVNTPVPQLQARSAVRGCSIRALPAFGGQTFSLPFLRKHFVGESKDCVSFLLSYLCNESVKHSQMQGQIMNKLLQSIVDQLQATEYTAMNMWICPFSPGL
uniref:Uncharacterized protein n=1 Tax=Ditylenchus dipsaci TaxID=166011 RepID=A0A915DHY5_9BILA